MINSMRRCAVPALAALTLVVSACSSSGGQPAASSPASQAGGPSSCKGSSGGADHVATRKAVINAFTVFFDSDSSVCQSEAVLQNGAVFHQTLIEQGKSDLAKSTSAKITSVSKVSNNVVAVKFTITSGSIHFPYHGNAVREGGRWKVAAKTLCGLLKVEGDAPAACNKSGVTALPH